MLYILYREQLSLIYLNSIPIPCKYLVHWLMSVWVLFPSSWNWAVCSKESFATVRSGRLFFCLLLPFPYYPATHASHTCALTITVVINGGCQLRCQLFASVFLPAPSTSPWPPSLHRLISFIISSVIRVISHHHLQRLDFMWGFVLLLLRADGLHWQNLPVEYKC